MAFLKTLMDGEQGAFKSRTLTPMQKITLRFVVMGLIFYGIVVIEGMLMRMYEVSPLSFLSDDQFFAIMTAHPLVGIFGSTYLLVMGAFTPFRDCADVLLADKYPIYDDSSTPGSVVYSLSVFQQ